MVDKNCDSALDLTCIKGFDHSSMQQDRLHNYHAETGERLESTRYKIVKVLLENGAIAASKELRNNPMHWAFWYADLHLINVLYEYTSSKLLFH
jgi:ankyrin repeat protein